MIRWLTLLLVLSLVALGQARATTYYIDYAGGSNGNNGTSTGTPWKSHPYMQTGAGCAGAAHSYSHAAGDRFIFKGGVTWPRACFGMRITQGGSSSSVMDYYGVDVTWFTGASFTHPIFDMQSQEPISTTDANSVATWNVINDTAGFITFDNLEEKNYFMGPHAQNSQALDCVIVTTGSNNYTSIVQNVYFHGMTTTTANLNAVSGSNCAGIGTDKMKQVKNSIFENSAGSVSGTPVHWGGCANNVLEFGPGNICHDYSQAVVGYYNSIHDNEIYNGSNVCCLAANYSNGDHTNTIESAWCIPGGDSLLHTMQDYNNYIHDNFTAQRAVPACEGEDVFNNVFSNNNGNISIQAAGGSPHPTIVTTIANNVIDCKNSNTVCISITQNGGCSSCAIAGTLNIYNNLYIDSSGFGQPIFSPTPPTGTLNKAPGVNGGYNMAPSEASSNGFTAANKYKGSPADSNVRNAGTNLTTSCGSLGALCSDTQGAPWFGGSYAARPTGATLWDLGAYVLSGVGPPTVTLSPSSLTFSTNRTTTSASQTTRLTNTGGSNLTISSVTTSGLFSQTNDCPLGPPITPGSFCTFTVTFSPNATGPFSGNLTVSDNATGSPHIVPLSGTGTAPIIGLSPASYAFGNVVINVPTASTNFALSNTGDGPLAVHLSTGGADAAFFSVNSACPAILNAGLSCIVQAIFTPLTITSYSGTLVETDPVATGSPTSNALTGSGVAVPLPTPVGLVPWIL